MDHRWSHLVKQFTEQSFRFVRLAAVRIIILLRFGFRRARFRIEFDVAGGPQRDQHSIQISLCFFDAFGRQQPAADHVADRLNLRSLCRTNRPATAKAIDHG